MRNVLVLLAAILSGCVFNNIETQTISIDYSESSVFDAYKKASHSIAFIDFNGTEDGDNIIFQSSNGGFVEIDINHTLGSAVNRWKINKGGDISRACCDTLRISIENIEVKKNVYDITYKAYELRLGIQIKIEYSSQKENKAGYINEKVKVKINDHNQLKQILEKNIDNLIIELIAGIDKYYDSIDKNL